MSENAVDNCILCAQPADNIKDSIRCYGFCAKSFHLSCLSKENANYKKSIVDLLSKIKNIHWYCDICDTLSVNGIASSLVSSAKLITDLKSTLRPLLDQPIKSKLSQLSKSETAIFNFYPGKHDANAADGEIPTIIIDEPNDTKQSSSVPVSPALRKVVKLKRRRANSLSVNHEPFSKSTALSKKLNHRSTVNSKPTSSLQSKMGISNTTTIPLQSKIFDVKNERGSTINSKLYDTKTIYLSPFLPDTTVNDISNHIKSHQCYNVVGDLNITKLVSDNKNTNKLSFVSFKIDVPNRYFDIMVDRSIWPSGVTAKEFEVKSIPSKNVYTNPKFKIKSSAKSPKNMKRASSKPQFRHQNQRKSVPNQTKLSETSHQVPPIANLLPLLTQCLINPWMTSHFQPQLTRHN